MAIRYNLIKKKVNELLDKNGAKSAPIPIEKVAGSAGATIRYRPLDNDLSGMVQRVDEKTAIIGINSSHADVRKRFSIAHEIGHLVLHDDENLHVDEEVRSNVQYRNEYSSLGVDDKEIEANQFAAEILMPEQMLLKDIERLKDKNPESAIEELAKLYDVSIQSMTIRLTRLGVIK